MFGNLGLGEILIILVLVLILFGPKKIPELAGTIGRGLNEFRRHVGEAQRAVTDPLRGDFTPTAPPPPPTYTLGAAPPPLTDEEEQARQPKRLLE